jgi:hypothetical protein
MQPWDTFSFRSLSIKSLSGRTYPRDARCGPCYDHVTVRAEQGFLYVDVDEEPIVRLEPLSGDHYGLSFHHHAGRWEPMPFSGDVGRLASVVMTEFGAYLESFFTS